MTKIDQLPYVEAELNYIAPTAERPRYYAYEPGPGDPPPNMVHEAHTMRIHDMRPITSEIGLDQQGFALVEQRSAVRDFWDDDEVRQVYYPEAERFIAEVMGASRVFIFDHVQRRASTASTAANPACRVSRRPGSHVDHTPGPARNGCATCWAPTPRNCCTAGSR